MTRRPPNPVGWLGTSGYMTIINEKERQRQKETRTMAEPTCDEVDRWLSEKFDEGAGRECPGSKVYAGRKCPHGHIYEHRVGTIPYCGPSADPMLALMKQLHLAWQATFTPTASVVWVAGSEKWQAGDAPELPEASARAVYAMLKAKEKIDADRA